MNARALVHCVAPSLPAMLVPAAGGAGRVAELLIDIAGWYAAAGAVVAALFLLAGIDRVEPAARGSWLFRVLLVPGLVLLWPIVLLRWLRLEQQRRGG